MIGPGGAGAGRGPACVAVAAALALSLAAIGPASAGPTAAKMPSPEEVVRVIGHLGPVPVPADNPLTEAKIALGERLFADTRLSGDGTISCRTCHLPDHGYATSDPLGPAYPSQHERRNSPTLVNVAYNEPLIWDGRAPDLDRQALGPIRNPLHMNGNLDLIALQLATDPGYRAAFAAAYGDSAITAERLGDAIASFERTLVFDDCPLDRYMDGDEAALDPAQRRGLALFTGRAHCTRCHHGPDLTDNDFHDLGVPDAAVTGDPLVMASVRFDARRMGLAGWDTITADPGRELVTKRPEDRGKFRTMGLRNVADSPPYMHDGSLPSLEAVVAFYDAGGGAGPGRSPLLEPLGLTAAERGDLVAFLRTSLEGTRRARGGGPGEAP